jgi:23S rRNA (cytidine1920-2'-O)/16S rRNA (cytidine1409-2'-O)-methyltransferase
MAGKRADPVGSDAAVRAGRRVGEAAMRADLLVVARGLAPTRSAARRLIEHGGLRWRDAAIAARDAWRPLRKAGAELPPDCALEVVDAAEVRWASRGGLKLEGALARTDVHADGRACLDIGQSTGGFTEVLLQHGAARVVGIDVGRGQLHPRLAADARVVAFEGVNVRALAEEPAGEEGSGASAARSDERLGAALAGGFDLVVADLSFISLVHALPAVARLLRPDGDALLLVKPQFELQPRDIGKGGIVRDAGAYAYVEGRLREASAARGLEGIDWFESAVEGGDGNREFFLRLRHPSTDSAA